MFLIAWAADRWGLLSGWATLLLVMRAGHAEIWVKAMFSDRLPVYISPGAIGVALLAAGAGVLLTLAVLRGPRPEDPRPFVRAPAAGWVPLTAAFSLLAVAAMLHALHIDLPDLVVDSLFAGAGRAVAVGDPVAALYGTPPRFAVALGLVALLAALFSWLYSRPGLWREGRRRLRGGTPIDPAAERRAFARAAVAGGGWALAMAAIYFLLFRSSPEALIPFGVAMLAPAIIVDAVAEWRARCRRDDLVSVWPLHQVQLADDVARALRAERIPVHLRGLRYRSLLHFFGPEVPIAVMVPMVDAERAHKLLAERLAPR
jgi:hypothetical protein